MPSEKREKERESAEREETDRKTQTGSEREEEMFSKKM